MDIKRCDRCNAPFEVDTENDINGIVFVNSNVGGGWISKGKKWIFVRAV